MTRGLTLFTQVKTSQQNWLSPTDFMAQVNNCLSVISRMKSTQTTTIISRSSHYTSFFPYCTHSSTALRALVSLWFQYHLVNMKHIYYSSSWGSAYEWIMRLLLLCRPSHCFNQIPARLLKTFTTNYWLEIRCVTGLIHVIGLRNTH